MRESKPAIVGILGGMGPAAGANFVQLFVQACDAFLKERGELVVDQSFPEHWLAQLPVPDRTNALIDGAPSPLPGMVAGLRQLKALGAKAVAIPCNTAHAWYDALQCSCPEVELLHIVEQTVGKLRMERVEAVGLMATTGTHKTRLYESALQRAGIHCHAPTRDEQLLVMNGICDGVKAGNLGLARMHLETIAQRLVERHGLSTLVLACTEIPLALRALSRHPGVRLIDPSDVLAKALAERAYTPPRSPEKAIPDRPFPAGARTAFPNMKGSSRARSLQ